MHYHVPQTTRYCATLHSRAFDTRFHGHSLGAASGCVIAVALHKSGEPPRGRLSLWPTRSRADSSSAMAAKPKLRYFDITGAAEPIRFVLEYAGIEYEDDRIAMEDFPSIKPTLPFGLLPVLELDGMVINQSTAICRYFAKKAGLAGSDDLEALRIDAIADTVVDFRNAHGIYYWRTPEAEKPEAKEKLQKETIPLYLSQFEKILKENKGYFVNGKLSYADLMFAGTVDYVNKVMQYDVSEGYPLIQALVEKVNNLPRIKAYISRRPDTIL